MGQEESSSDDDAVSQTTEDDPRIPENQEVPVPPVPPPPPMPVPQSSGQVAQASGTVAPPPSGADKTRERPRYELRHTMRGHTKSLSAVKFSPDGTILASCGL